MSYTDTTLVADTANGYPQVHDGQLYATVAAQLAAHPAWEFVDGPLDFVFNSNQTHRTYVWRNKSAVSGLRADFYVIFRVWWDQSKGLYFSARGMEMALCEQYDAATHTASKIAIAASNLTQTLLADGSNPTTWTLTSAAPATQPNSVGLAGIFVSSSDTSYRLLSLVTNDVVLLMTRTFTTGGWQQAQFYVGAFETLLSADDDPLPIILAPSGTSTGYTSTMSGSYGYWSSTRHPMCGGQTGAYFFGFAPGNWNSNTFGSNTGFALGPLFDSVLSANAATLGTPGDPEASLWEGGAVPVSKCCIRSYNVTSTSSTIRGGVRGFLKYIRAANLPTGVTIGDKFYIDGNLWVSNGAQVGGLMDTTA